MPNLPIADLHSHFPMRLTAPERRKGPDGSLLAVLAGNAVDVLHAGLLDLARRLLNDVTFHGGPAVSIDRYLEGNVALACSVLYSPFDELSLAGLLQRPPSRDAFASVLHQLADVELEVSRHPRALVARNRTDLARAAAEEKVAIVHCIEGGLQLGESVQAVLCNVALLRRLGVLYVTLAHLLYRQVATNAPAFPMLSDRTYRHLHPQPDSGLTDLGRAAVEAMTHHRMLVDLTHMSERAMEETFVLLDTLDPAGTMPVIASHIACRLGSLAYNLDDRFIERIHRRGGVMGVILCEHYAEDGLEVHADTAEEALAIIFRHIDRIHDVTGSYDCIAIGSDHDGFIRPALHGFEDPRSFGRLSDALLARYGAEIAGKICLGNVRRVIDAVWT